MEEELIAQRDAAIAVSKELQKQLQSQRDVIEGRAMNAERLRLEAEDKVKSLQHERKWEAQQNRNILRCALLCGSIGAGCGWLIGVFIALIVQQAILGYLFVVPAMALGSISGLAAAQVKSQMDAKNYYTQRKDSNSLLTMNLTESDPSQNTTRSDLHRKNNENSRMPSLSSIFGFAYSTAITTKDITLSIFRSKSILSGMFFPMEKQE